MWPLSGYPSTLEQPPVPELSCRNYYRNCTDLQDANYWRKLCPQLHCCESLPQSGKVAQLCRVLTTKNIYPEQTLVDGLRSQAINSGYFCVPSREISWSVDLPKIAEAVVTLIQVLEDVFVVVTLPVRVSSHVCCYVR
jgi:hypothetical protein